MGRKALILDGRRPQCYALLMTHLTLMFIALTHTYSLPPGLLSAVCFVESKHNPAAMHRDDGGANSVGLCQVQLPTASLLGFKGSEAELREMDTNITIAARYLSHQLLRYRGDVGKAVAAYNAGSYRINDKGQTKNYKYVAKVLRAWGEHK